MVQKQDSASKESGEAALCGEVKPPTTSLIIELLNQSALISSVAARILFVKSLLSVS